MSRSAVVGHHELGDRIERHELAKTGLAREVQTARIFYPGKNSLSIFPFGGYTRNDQTAFGQRGQETLTKKRKVIDGPLSQWKNIRGVGIYQNDYFFTLAVQARGREFLAHAFSVEGSRHVFGRNQ